MKKYASLALAFVLTASLLVGCGCTNRNRPMDTIPTTMPTNANTEPTHNTVPHTETTHSTEATMDHGNGPLEDFTESTTDQTRDTTGTTENTVEGQTRNASPRMR